MADDLNRQLKEMMVEELMLPTAAESIGDDTPVFGPEGLGLDSVDALQLVVALEKRFGLKLADGAEARAALASVNAMAAAVRAHRSAAA